MGIEKCGGRSRGKRREQTMLREKRKEKTNRNRE
jgi:hypothetical protein